MRVGVLGSARATNEDNYVPQKFARVVLGTNNVDCCARVCHAPTRGGARARCSAPARRPTRFDDIERAATILVCGANATENHPVVGARIKQAALRGAKLIVIDPRRIELARVRRRPSAARARARTSRCSTRWRHAIVDEGLADEAFCASASTVSTTFARSCPRFRPERVADRCGRRRRSCIRDAARLYARDTPAIAFHGLGMTEHVQGTDGVMALANLALLTGNVGKPGSGVNPLRGQNNVQGAAHMGCEPATLTGTAPHRRGARRASTRSGARRPERARSDA